MVPQTSKLLPDGVGIRAGRRWEGTTLCGGDEAWTGRKATVVGLGQFLRHRHLVWRCRVRVQASEAFDAGDGVGDGRAAGISGMRARDGGMLAVVVAHDDERRADIRGFCKKKEGVNQVMDNESDALKWLIFERERVIDALAASLTVLPFSRATFIRVVQ